MALLLRTFESVQRTPSTLSFAQYREAESQNYKQSSVTSDGELLDVLTLELRVHPPNVRPVPRAAALLPRCAPPASARHCRSRAALCAVDTRPTPPLPAPLFYSPQVLIDNETYEDRTIITVDSANRPGTLVEVVQVGGGPGGGEQRGGAVVFRRQAAPPAFDWPAGLVLSRGLAARSGARSPQPPEDGAARTTLRARASPQTFKPPQPRPAPGRRRRRRSASPSSAST
jgi:hypothetical protein